MLFKFTQATNADKGYLLELRKKTILVHLEESDQFLTEQDHIDRVDHKFECSYLVFHKEELIGTVKYQSSEEEVELIQLQIEPRHQAKGYGSGVFQQILSNARDKTVRLTVLKNNPAVGLYMRLGFQIIDEDEYEYHMQYYLFEI